ncbi:hypothetical protein [Paenibacillus turpanensis]|uniref:hypothetical protein n=1 Tax=Paenibacillus turpanensis TaxID=2689078 RepID=UPI001A9EA72E|nr:hypothetical protein [Paenibacillus turpanensis]
MTRSLALKHYFGMELAQRLSGLIAPHNPVITSTILRRIIRRRRWLGFGSESNEAESTRDGWFVEE